MNDKPKKNRIVVIIALIMTFIMFIVLPLIITLTSFERKNVDFKQKKVLIENIFLDKKSSRITAIKFIDDDNIYRIESFFSSHFKEKGYEELLKAKPVCDILYSQYTSFLIFESYTICQIKVGNEFILTKEEAISGFERNFKFMLYISLFTIFFSTYFMVKSIRKNFPKFLVFR